MQHEVTTEIPLLDAAGNLTQPGYAKRMLFRYRRGDIKASAFRIKEWDYYCIGNDRFALALTIGICLGVYSSVFVSAAIALYLGVKREDLVKTVKKDEVEEMVP